MSANLISEGGRICSCFHQESNSCSSCRGNWSWGLDKNQLANENIQHNLLDKFALQRILKKRKTQVKAKTQKIGTLLSQKKIAADAHNPDGTIKLLYLLLCGIHNHFKIEGPLNVLARWNRHQKKYLSMRLFRILGSAARYSLVNEVVFEQLLLSAGHIRRLQANVKFGAVNRTDVQLFLQSVAKIFCMAGGASGFRSGSVRKTSRAKIRRMERN